MSDLLTAVGIMLVFITVFFDILTNEYKTLKSKPDESKKIEIQNYKKILYSLLFKFIFLFFGYSILFYILLPEGVKIIISSKLDFWNFDPLNTLYCFIEVFIIIFLIINLVMIISILKKILK